MEADILVVSYFLYFFLGFINHCKKRLILGNRLQFILDCRMNKLKGCTVNKSYLRVLKWDCSAYIVLVVLSWRFKIRFGSQPRVCASLCSRALECVGLDTNSTPFHRWAYLELECGTGKKSCSRFCIKTNTYENLERSYYHDGIINNLRM